MRLLLVTETFPPEVNGVARTLGRWVSTFQQRGHHVTVLRPRQDHEPMQRDLVRGWGLPFYPEVRIGITSPTSVRNVINETQPDLIHVATEGTLGCSTILGTTGLKTPLASSFHTNYDVYMGHYGFGAVQWLGEHYLRWFHNATALTLVPSEGTRQRLASEGYQRLAIWPRGVDGEAFNPKYRDPALRESLGLEADDPLILYVGRLAPEKNVPALLDAFQRLTQLPDCRAQLALVGGGPLVDQLKKQKQPRVTLAGYQHGADLSRWYASADLFVFPSLTDTFGNVMLEAQASGLPVVGFDVAPVNERITQEKDGLLVPLNQDLLPCLQRLCQDTALRRRCGQEARRTADRQDWQSIFDCLEARYLALVDGKDPLCV